MDAKCCFDFQVEETWQASKGKQRETQRICTDFGEKNHCLGISKQSPERTNKEADAVVWLNATLIKLINFEQTIIVHSDSQDAIKEINLN